MLKRRILLPLGMVAMLLMSMLPAVVPASADNATGSNQQIASGAGNSISVSDSVYSSGDQGSASVAASVYGLGDQGSASVVASVYSSNGLTTGDATNVAASAATLNGSLISSGGAGINECGFFYSTDQTYWMQVSAGNIDTTGYFSYALSGLTANTEYYFKAYDTNSAGISYGAVCSFKTKSVLNLTAGGASLSDGTMNTPYISEAITNYVCASNGAGPYSFSVDSSTLPIGLSFSNNVISGTPCDIGMYNVAVTVTDSNNDQPANITLFLQIDFPDSDGRY
jgi:hypothetical protein